ncbi:MAG: tRNA-(ms[2]io[6]A)-hydroxylase [bacterium]|nr:tRNA-(ms[2]io[6]A)-hydroxylase [bacterium]
MIALSPSSDGWVRGACADLSTLLVDHAHCEKRAASTAVRYLFRYPDWPALVGAMSRLAREELVHFERVLKELEARGVAFRGLPSANYATALFALVRSNDARARKVDEMLCCALIEARSHERFERLQAAVDDARLARFYGELAEAEARHGELYIELAVEAADGDAAAVQARLAVLAAAEGEIVARPGQAIRMHAGG